MAYYNSTTGAKVSLFVLPNMAPLLTLAGSDVMTTTIPNPSSQLATMPGVNILDPKRSKVTRSAGCFRFYSATNKGYSFGGCYKIAFKTKAADGYTDVAVTEGTYETPYDACAELKAVLDANDPNGNTHTVTWDGRRESGDDATFKFTFAHNGADSDGLWLDPTAANSIFPAIGLPVADGVQDDTSAPYSITMPDPACHTEEYWIIEWDENLESYWVSEAGSASAFITLFPILDSNLRFGYCSSFADGGPNEMPKVYVYSAAGGGTIEFDQNDSAFSEGTTLFTFPGRSAADFPSYIGRDTYMYAGQSNGGLDAHFNRQILIDFADWANDFDWLNGKGFIKLKVSDPRHPDGYIQIGTTPCGPGWYPGKGYNFSAHWKPVDPSKLKRNRAASRFVNASGKIYREGRISYARSGINDGTTNASGVPFETAPWVEFFYHHYARYIHNMDTDKDTKFALSSLHAGSVGRGRVPFMFIDRSQDPAISNTTRAAQPHASYYHTAGYTPASVYCFFAEDPDWERQFNSRWGVEFHLEEEV